MFRKNNRHRITILLYTVLSMFYNEIRCQTNIIPPSPTAFEFQKYSTVKVDESTGVPAITIPICNIEQGGMSVPIFFSYYSSGVKVDALASWVGLGWSLNAGGVITREVRGEPDEYNEELISDYDYPSRFPVSHFDFYSGDCYEFEYLDSIGNFYGEGRIDNWCNNYVQYQNHGMDEYFDYKYIKNGQYDSSPDIYHYNFNGRVGKFIIDNQKNVQNIPKNELKIIPVWSQNKISGFIIKDGSGNRYNFGVAEKNVEIRNLNSDVCGYSTVKEDEVDSHNGYRTESLAWYLSSISNMQNNSNITFTYEDEYLAYALKRKTTGLFEVFAHDRPSDRRDCDDAKFGWTVNRVEGKRLKTITWKKGHIDFVSYNSNREDMFIRDSARYDGNGGWQYYTRNVNSKALNYIRIYDDNDDLYKEFDLAHSYYKSKGFSDDLPNAPVYDRRNHNVILKCNYKRLFLNSITEKNAVGDSLKPYLFDYNSMILPPRLSAERDFWGYYNGNSATTLLPKLWYYPDDNLSISNPTPYSIYKRSSFNGVELLLNNSKMTGDQSDFESDSVVAERSPDKNYIKAGILEKITYPTGGYIKYNYEINKYRWDNKNNDGGGVRIASTSIYFSDSDSLTTNYYYQVGNSNRSSGKIINIPRFAIDVIKHPVFLGDTTTDYSTILSSDIVANNPVSIIYTEVKKEIVGNGYEILHFDCPVSNGIERADAVDGTYVYNNTLANASYSPRWETVKKDAVYSPLLPNPNYGWANGKLNKICVYDSDDRKVKEERYSYTIQNVDKINAYFSQKNPVRIVSPYYYISAQKVMSHKTTKLFNSDNTNDSIEINESYTYNQYGQIKEKSHSDSDGNLLKTTFKYPSDYQFNVSSDDAPDIPSSAIDKMISGNMVSQPIEEIMLKSEGTNTKVIGGKISSYKVRYNNGEYVTLSKMLQLNIDDPLSYTSSFNSYIEVKDIAGNDQEFNFICNDNYQEEVLFNSFDNQGNPTQIITKDGMSTYYVWGYNFQYPIAKIVNYTKDQFEANTNLQYYIYNLDDYTSKETNFKENLDIANTTIRYCETDKNVQIYTYTYDPLIGMTSQTDPNGRTTYYEYDSFGRLEYIRDQDDNIIKKYEYNYATYNGITPTQ